eukprot:TRINITY_DN8055_c0_g1_i4.p1 TRINITY_DN8055_c0_g1~~TRINITY_DN8055_c0_g1_i4.p1  ORF type:complete len:320 (+),score=102.86 TRINITY_DN8055_c0_g1_i4:83-961(+)
MGGGLLLYLLKETGQQIAAEVPPDATVDTLRQAFDLPVTTVLVYSGERLLDPTAAIADLGIGAEAQLTCSKERVQYGSLAPRGPDCPVQEKEATAEEEDGLLGLMQFQEVERELTPLSERWIGYEYGTLSQGDEWAQEFIPPAGCGALVRAEFYLRGINSGALVQLMVCRWLSGDPGGEPGEDACGEVIYQHDPVVPPEIPKAGPEMKTVWELPGVPVHAGKRYAVVFKHVGSGADGVVHFGWADNQFSKCTKPDGLPPLGSRHSQDGGIGKRPTSWGTLGGGDLAFLLEFI